MEQLVKAAYDSYQDALADLKVGYVNNAFALSAGHIYKSFKLLLEAYLNHKGLNSSGDIKIDYDSACEGGLQDTFHLGEYISKIQLWNIDSKVIVNIEYSDIDITLDILAIFYNYVKHLSTVTC